MMQINKDEFQIFDAVRKEKENKNEIVEITGIAKEKIIEIAKNYDYYREKFESKEDEESIRVKEVGKRKDRKVLNVFVKEKGKMVHRKNIIIGDDGDVKVFNVVTK